MNQIILIDDDPKFREEFEKRFRELEISSSLTYFRTVDEFEKGYSSLNKVEIGVFIFDLSINKGEDTSRTFAIADKIKKIYSDERYIIIIHSGYLSYFEDFNESGTVYKIEKDSKSISTICEKIKLFEESNFMDLFRKEGYIEGILIKELHKSFTNQFKGEEIINLLDSIKHSSGDKLAERTKDVFCRIAVGSLYQNLHEKNIGNHSEEPVLLNSIENYYYRTSFHKYMTGDIFKSAYRNFVIVLNPRCNLANNKFTDLLYCSINPFTTENLKTYKNESDVRKGLTDNVTSSLISDRYRFLPRTPKFDGGLIDFNTYKTASPEVFDKDFTRYISLTDDLVNDIVRKFSSYIVRGGVYENETKEAQFYFQTLA